MSDTLVRGVEFPHELLGAQQELAKHLLRLRDSMDPQPFYLARWLEELSDPCFVQAYSDAKERVLTGRAYPKEERFFKALGIEVTSRDIDDLPRLGTILLDSALDQLKEDQPAVTED